MNKTQVIVPVGISFSGKSTLARAISKVKKIAHVDINNIIVKAGLEGTNTIGTEFAFLDDEALKMSEEFLKKRKSVIIDITPLTKSKRDQIRHLADKYNAQVILIYVDTPSDVARDRLNENKKDKKRMTVNYSTFQYTIDNFEPPIKETQLIFRNGQNINKWIKENFP